MGPALCPGESQPELRIDRLLWMLRLTKSRAAAQRLVAEGHIRLDGRRVTRPACCVHAGQILTLPLAPAVRVIEILGLPARRGPAEEARRHYREIASVSQQAATA